MNEFIRPLSADSCADDEPTSLAELSIVLEPVPDATIGELAGSLAKAILIAMGDRIPRQGQRQPPEDFSGSAASTG